jgi:hypothetical protein
MSDSESTENSDSRAKVAAIFCGLVGDRAVRVDASRHNADAIAIIARALSPTPGDRRAHDIAFHLSDWASDAAFIVAVQLFPERFTSVEIARGVNRFLIHVPNHVAAAAALSCHPVEDIFEVGALGETRIEDSSFVSFE